MNKSKAGRVPTGKGAWFSIETPQAQSITTPVLMQDDFFFLSQSTLIIIPLAVQLEMCFSALFVWDRDECTVEVKRCCQK